MDKLVGLYREMEAIRPEPVRLLSKVPLMRHIGVVNHGHTYVIGDDALAALPRTMVDHVSLTGIPIEAFGSRPDHWDLVRPFYEAIGEKWAKMPGVTFPLWPPIS